MNAAERSRTITQAGPRVLILALVAGSLALPPAAAQSAAEPVATLTIEQAVETALKKNRLVEIADRQVQVAQQELTAERTRRLPTLGVGLTGQARLVPSTLAPGLDTPPSPGDVPIILDQARITAVYGAAIGQPITGLRRIGLEIRLREVALETAREALRLEEQKVTASVRKTYFGLLSTQAARDAIEESLTFNRELERVVAARVAQGQSLEVDLLEVRSQGTIFGHQALTHRQDFAAGKEQLNLFLGRDVRTDFRVEAVPDVAPTERDLAVLQEAALRQRPEVARASLGVDSSRLDRQLASAEFIPELIAGLIYLRPHNLPSVAPDNVVFGVQLTWEVWDWGRRRATVRARQLEVAQSRTQLDQVEAEVLIDVNTQFRALQTAGDSVRVARARQGLERERVRVLQARYEAQLEVLSEVLHAQAALADASSRYIKALNELQTAAAELSRAIGEG